jgi:hypothetical protein
MDSTDKQAGQPGQNGTAKREGQHGQAAANTLQRPETETARTPPVEVEKALASSGRQGPVQANPAIEASRTGSTAPARASSTTLHDAQPRSIDTLNDGSLDSTVDTDGKAQEARRDLPILRDHVISSNASLDDSVDTPDEGLAGIESRPGGNAPLIVPDAGYAVEYVGSREVAGRRQIDEQDDAAGDSRALEPDNGARMAHLVKISPKK